MLFRSNHDATCFGLPPNISDWPTFPQVFVKGELIGGCDIVSEMHEAGDLQTLIDGIAKK